MKKKLTIPKLDAAKRQLEAAIRLYFYNGDPVSIHTLCDAAYNVIRNINTKRDGEVMIKELLVCCAKEGHEKEMLQKINNAANFFKHAERDHEDTLDFDPEQSGWLIFEACFVYQNLSGERPPLFQLYIKWFKINYPDVLKFSEEEERVFSMTREVIIDLGRENYFKTFMPFAFRIL